MTLKVCSNLCSSQKGRLKPHLLKWLKFKRLTMQSIEKQVEQLEVSPIAGKM